MKKNIRILFVMLAIALFSCIDPVSYPDEPAIKYKSFGYLDTLDELGNKILLCRLTFECTDGDGNLGLREDDTIGRFHFDSMYYHNCFITLYEKLEGEYKKIDIPIEHNYRIPYTPPTGQSPALIADVIVKMEYPVAYFNYDTIRYEFYVVDRDFTRSNTVTTPDIFFTEDVTVTK